MAATAGRKALVKVTGTAVVFTDEATTANGARTRYQITDTAKRVWSRTAAITVERDTGGGFGVVPATEYTVNRLKGTIIFGASQAVGAVIRVDGSYLPMSTAAEARSFGVACSAGNFEATRFGDTHTRRLQGLKDVRGTLGSWRTTDTYFDTQLTNGTVVVLEFFSDSSLEADLKVWALLASEQIQAVVDGGVEQTVEFEGTPDADARVVSWDDPASAGYVTSGLLHMWHPDAGTGQTIADVGGGTAVPLTLGSTAGADAQDPSWGTSGGPHVRGVTDDLVQNLVANGDIEDVSVASFEIVLYIESGSTTTNGYLFGYQDRDQGAAAYLLGITVADDGGAAVAVNTPGGVQSVTAPAGTFPKDAWHHIVATIDGTTTRIYKNGVQVASGATGAINAAGEAGANNQVTLFELNSANHNTNPIRYGTVRMYNRALSVSEVSQNYADRKGVYAGIP